MIVDYLTSSLFGEWISGLSAPHVFFTVVTLLVLYNWPVWDRHLLPPGPWPLPFVGNTLWMASAADLSKEIYGELSLGCCRPESQQCCCPMEGGIPTLLG